MDNNDENFGIPITADVANECITEYQKIYATIISRLVTNGSDPDDFAVNTYFKKKYNAFVFGKDMVMRYFNGAGSATHLMVILGAQPKGDPKTLFLKHEPTVILVGCTRNGNDFLSLKMDKPATEHPPRSIRTSMPLNSDGQMTFNFV